ncbi:hypothetical protein W823_17475 [Williamsia sp. D3]|nr:hypothetical protein W823_17475 [Williamsia sp. D3]
MLRMTDLNLDTEQMLAAAAKLAAMYADSDEQFRSGHQQLSGALAEGWVGKSAQTMAEVMGRWQPTVGAMVARVNSHSGGVAKANGRLVERDDAAADSIVMGSTAALNL